MRIFFSTYIIAFIFLADLLTVAPGLSTGMTFEGSKSIDNIKQDTPFAEKATLTVINLTDILSQDFDDLGDWEKDEDEAEKSTEKVQNMIYFLSLNVTQK